MSSFRNIVIFVASESKNLDLAEKFKNCLIETGCDVVIINMVELDLPLYTSRIEKRHDPNELLAKELPFIKEAHGFVFIAPEYNGSTPPVFNNFLAWLSRTNKDWRMHLNGKPAVIATFSGGGGFNVLLTMRTQLSYIGMNVLGRQLLTHANKALDDKVLMQVSKELVRISGY